MHSGEDLRREFSAIRGADKNGGFKKLKVRENRNILKITNPQEACKQIKELELQE